MGLVFVYVILAKVCGLENEVNVPLPQFYEDRTLNPIKHLNLTLPKTFDYSTTSDYTLRFILNKESPVHGVKVDVQNVEVFDLELNVNFADNIRVRSAVQSNYVSNKYTIIM